MTDQNRKWLADSLVERCLICLIAFIAAVSFGFTYGDYISNHPVYLLEGLRLSQPGFLTNDWFTSETAQYHQRFTWLVVTLKSLNILEWGLAIIHTMIVTASLLLMAAIMRLLDPVRYIYAWLAFLVIFVAVDETKSVAASYLFTPALQPSGIAALGYLGAIYLFMRRSYWMSGLCLAAAGLFHTNYLVLGFLFFGLAHLTLGRPQIIKRGLAQFSLPLLLFAIELPNILATMGLELPQEIRDQAARIFLSNLAQHYLPATFWPSFIPLIGWHIAGFAFFAGMKDRNRFFEQFWALHVGLLILIAAATFFSSLVFIETVARLFVLRIAPFSLMFAQMLVALALTRMWLGHNRETYATLSRPRLLAASIGLGFVISYEGATQGLSHTNTLIYGLVLAFMWLAYLGKERVTDLLFRWRLSENTQLMAVSIVALLVGFSAIQSDFKPRVFSLVCDSCANRIEMELYDWVKSSTEADAMFLIPHRLRGMRLLGERAIVVDAKAIPYDPENLEEWNQRMGLIRRYFDGQDQGQLPTILSTYQPDYIVFDKRRGHQSTGQIVFENRRFQVTRAPQLP